jgi:hypothetical protein
MPFFLQALFDWFELVHADLYAVTALIAIVWAASEVIVGYPEQPSQALWTWGAWLLFILNAVFACFVLAASLALVPNSESIWLALGVGLSWQAMLRGGINIQPLPISSVGGERSEESLGVPLNELYTRLQSFCVGQIQRQLVGRRISLMEHAIEKLEVPQLARTARLVMAAMGEATDQAEQYIQKIETTDSLSEERKEIMLISLILDKGAEDTLRQHARESEREKRRGG